MSIPSPTPGHVRLTSLVGTWEGEETMYPSEWDPEGGVAFGRNTFVVDLGGFVLLADYEQERDHIVTFSGHGVFTYDPSLDRYTLHWFDSRGSPPEVFIGGFDDAGVLALAHGGPGMHARMTYDLTTPGVLAATMEMSSDVQDWRLVFKASYRRV